MEGTTVTVVAKLPTMATSSLVMEVAFPCNLFFIFVTSTLPQQHQRMVGAFNFVRSSSTSHYHDCSIICIISLSIPPWVLPRARKLPKLHARLDARSTMARRSVPIPDSYLLQTQQADFHVDLVVERHSSTSPMKLSTVLWTRQSAVHYYQTYLVLKVVV